MAMELDAPLDTMATASKGDAALQQLRGTDPALFLSPSADLAAAAREASQRIYSSLAPFSPAHPPPLPSLLAGPAFDAEQVWSQIELLARPLLPHLRRQLRRLEQQPQAPAPRVETPAGDGEEQSEEGEEGSEFEELKEEEDEELEGSDDEDEMAEEDEAELEGKGGNGVEDKFLKTKDLEEFLEQAEEQEYGIGGGAKRGEKKKAKKNWMEEDSGDDDDEGMEEDEGDEEGEEDEDEDELNLEDFEDDDEEDGGETGGDIMYKDFF